MFSVYLTGTVGDDLPGDTSPASWLGRALALSGLVVALLAPVTGVWVDAPRRRRRALAVLTGLVVVLTAAMSLIRDDHRYLWPGLILLACTAACSELATVPYNAMLRQLSTPENSGRISGFGLALGYFGSVAGCCSWCTSGSSPAPATPADCSACRSTTARTCGRRCC